MDIITLISAATGLNWIGKLVYGLYDSVSSWGGSFGVTVIFFTLILKTIMSPLDLWQKHVTRKNNKIMEEMKPQLQKLQKQFGNDKALYNQKQMALYKEKGYSMLGSCIPMIVTMVLFIVVFSGFNSCVRYENYTKYMALEDAYYVAYDAEYAKASDETAATAAAEGAVLDLHKLERFLWVDNIFMPDTWKEPIPSAETFMGSGIGKLNISDIDAKEYNKVMKPLFKKYNYNESGKKVWNGYLALPIVALGLNILSQLLMKPFSGNMQQPTMGDEKTQKMQQQQMKMLTYLMPVMIGVFSLFYSTAFTLYMLINSAFTLVFNLAYNLITKAIDDRERERKASTTFIR